MHGLDWEIVIKLCLAAVLGLVIGLEREIKRKQLGFKTCLVISISSCLLTIVSIESAYLFKGSPHHVTINMDPLRLAAQIVSGVGFIGAGVILKKGSDSVSGLTTAALIWAASGIGISVGAGFYLPATVGVLLLIISVELLPLFFSFIGLKPLGEKEILLQLEIYDKKQIANILSELKKNKLTIHHIHIRDFSQEHSIQLKVAIDQRRKIVDVYHQILAIHGIAGIEIETI